MKNPANFGVAVPIPLKHYVIREDLLRNAELFHMPQFPYYKHGEQQPVKTAHGERHRPSELVVDRQAQGDILTCTTVKLME